VIHVMLHNAACDHFDHDTSVYVRVSIYIYMSMTLWKNQLMCVGVRSYVGVSMRAVEESIHVCVHT